MKSLLVINPILPDLDSKSIIDNKSKQNFNKSSFLLDKTVDDGENTDKMEIACLKIKKLEEGLKKKNNEYIILSNNCQKLEKENMEVELNLCIYKKFNYS